MGTLESKRFYKNFENKKIFREVFIEAVKIFLFSTVVVRSNKEIFSQRLYLCHRLSLAISCFKRVEV